MRRFSLLFVVPSLALLVLAVLPLMTGSGTLVLRDVLTSHYPLKVAQAEALRHGEVPLIDLYRAGGQPLLGNPNALPLYPTNVLYLFGSDLWALNAHFWIHLLLAPAAFFWLGRAWGLDRPAAWAAGIFYGASGFFLSLLNLYNLVAGAALAPAFIAAALGLWKDPRRRVVLALAFLWTLLVLAGDPLFALLSLLLATAAGFVRHRSWPSRPVALVATLACATALAAPMWVEFLRILPLSFRGYWRYSVDAALVQSWDPRTALEWLLPLFFGLPDFSFWGASFYGGLPPLFFSFYPGLLALALIVVARWRGPAAAWAWGAVGSGIFFALGSWNPLVRWLYHVPGVSVLRFPVKMWLVVAIGCALLAGLGFERVRKGEGRRPLGRVLGILAFAFLTAWVLINFTAAGGLLRSLAPERLAGAAFDHQRLRWAGLCLLSLVVLALLAAALWLGRRRPQLSGALLVAVHLSFQLFFLRPLYTSDESAPYRAPPELLALVPEGARVVHGGFKELFGTHRLSPGASLPDLGTQHLTRIHFTQLYPHSGIPWGRRYELNHSPEGLDSFFTIALAQAMKGMDDAQRVQVLAASGVEILLLDRPLDPVALSPWGDPGGETLSPWGDSGGETLSPWGDSGGETLSPWGDPGGETLPRVHERARMPTPLGELHVYELAAPAAPVQLVEQVLRAPEMKAALRFLTDPRFDPRTTVVLPGEGAVSTSAGGRATLVAESAEEIEVEVDARSESTLLVQRTYHGIFRATVDGEPVEVEPANIHRMAVAVPAGTHRVRIWADRRPTRLAWTAAALGLLGLLGFAVRPGHREGA